MASPSTPTPSEGPLSPNEEGGRTRWEALRDIVLGTDSYGIVFLFLLVDYVFLTVGWSGSAALIVTAIWLGLTVLLAFRTSEVPHRLMVVVRVAVAVVVASAIGVAVGGGDRDYGVIVILSSLLVLASPIAIGWRLLHHTRVTTQTVLGALCIYVLIGLVFANADYGVQLVSGHSFFAQPGDHGPGRLRVLQLHHHGDRGVRRSDAGHGSPPHQCSARGVDRPDLPGRARRPSGRDVHPVLPVGARAAW